MTGRDMDDDAYRTPTASSGSWEELSPNQRSKISRIRVISCVSDPRGTPARMRALREGLDVARDGG